jgi:hypothetical protein
MKQGPKELAHLNDEDILGRIETGIHARKELQKRMAMRTIPIAVLAAAAVFVLKNGLLVGILVAGIGVCVAWFGVAFIASLRNERALAIAASELRSRGRMDLVDGISGFAIGDTGHDWRLMALLVLIGICMAPGLVYAVVLSTGGPEPEGIFAQIVMGGASVGLILVVVLLVILGSRAARAKK